MSSVSRSPRSNAGQVSGRFALGWLYLVGLVLALATLSPAPARAQDAKKGDEAKAKAEPGAVADPQAPPKKSMLRWAADASGPIGFCLLLISIYFTAIVIRLFMEFRMSEAVPPALIEKLDALIKERKIQEAYDACREDGSFLAKLVQTGIANLLNGRAEAKEAMNIVAGEVVVTMETRISYLATIGTLGPMIGLVGTIWGMIQSFQVIATAAGSQPRADQVAEGISTALFITLEGVSLSVPAIFFYALFRNRIAMMAMEANRVADRLINGVWAVANKPGQAKPAASAV